MHLTTVNEGILVPTNSSISSTIFTFLTNYQLVGIFTTLLHIVHSKLLCILFPLYSARLLPKLVSDRWRGTHSWGCRCCRCSRDYGNHRGSRSSGGSRGSRGGRGTTQGVKLWGGGQTEADMIISQHLPHKLKGHRWPSCENSRSQCSLCQQAEGSPAWRGPIRQKRQSHTNRHTHKYTNTYTHACTNIQHDQRLRICIAY